ncbi:MAG: phage terminase large subunit [Chloroflexi bacterium]|nr:phage terminase large subunit [Chloroflexota bacterium]
MAAMWRPHRGPQERFHASGAFELLYGGAAGGGKSDSLLMEALRYVHVPGYAAVILRRSYPMLAQAGGLIPRARELLTGVARWNEQRKTWTFASGATLEFGNMLHENDRYDYQGAAFAYVGFDELTQFTEAQYLYLFSRARTTAAMPDGRAVPVRVRATTNPGGEGHEWVRRRWGAWLGDAPTARSGEVRHYRQVDDVDRETTADDPGALSRQFIAASVYDNPTLLSNDPAYIQRLEALPLIERERLLGGNWSIAPAGNVFRREWFRVVERAPEGLRWARYWDLAASTKTTADYTASVAVAMGPDGTVYLRDMIRGRWEWPDQERILVQTMLTEPSTDHGIEQALHGIAAWQALVRRPELARVAIRGVVVDKDKLTRALPLSARAEQGKVALVAGDWNVAFLNELGMFSGDGTAHDDQVDTAAGGLAMLSRPMGVEYAPNLWR